MTWLLLILAALFGRPRTIPRTAEKRLQLAGVEAAEAFVGLLAHYIAAGRPEEFDALDAAWAGRWLDVLTQLAWRHAPRAARALPPLGVRPETLAETFARVEAIGAVMRAPAERRKPKRRFVFKWSRRRRRLPPVPQRALELSG